MSHRKVNYKNMGRSNLSFLNADGTPLEQTQPFLNALKIHNDNMDKLRAQLEQELATIKGYSQSEVNQRNDIYAKYENLYKVENARWTSEQNSLQKSSNIDSILGKVSSSLTTTQGVLSSLGINAPSQDKKPPIGGKDAYPPASKDLKKYLPFAIGGVVLLGLGFVLYKIKK